jgi:pheromone a factor receptor
MSTNNTITFNRYFRLMALATVDLLLTIPFSAFIIYANLKYGKVAPWISWERTHRGFSRINEVPAHLWRSRADTQFSVEFSRWAVVACGFSFFMFFGFGRGDQELSKGLRLPRKSVRNKGFFDKHGGSGFVRKPQPTCAINPRLYLPGSNPCIGFEDLIFGHEHPAILT